MHIPSTASYHAVLGSKHSRSYVNIVDLLVTRICLYQRHVLRARSSSREVICCVLKPTAVYYPSRLFKSKNFDDSGEVRSLLISSLSKY